MNDVRFAISDLVKKVTGGGSSSSTATEEETQFINMIDRLRRGLSLGALLDITKVRAVPATFAP